jgi:hypothetical protein
VWRQHLHLADLLDQVNPIRTAVRAVPATISLGAGFQGRAFLKEDRNQGAIHLVAHILPIHELAARQRHRFVHGDHLVENVLKNLAEPFTSLLPIRQRCHGLLQECKGNHHHLLYRHAGNHAPPKVSRTRY